MFYEELLAHDIQSELLYILFVVMFIREKFYTIPGSRSQISSQLFVNIIWECVVFYSGQIS